MEVSMKQLPPIDTDYLLDFLSGLVNTPSPTGFTDAAIEYTEQALKAFPFLEIQRTPKGALIATWPGERSDAPRALTAHTDTLGAMVKEIKTNGRLRLTKLGGFGWSAVEGEAAQCSPKAEIPCAARSCLPTHLFTFTAKNFMKPNAMTTT